MTLRLVSIFCLFCLVPSASAAMAATVRGSVFDDANGNGALDRGERGVADVAVSNGRDVARSDAHGRYTLATQPGQTIFVIKPAGWRFHDNPDGLPGFWHQQPVARTTGLNYGGLPTGPLLANIDFALRRASASRGDLDVLVFADPQPKSDIDIGYYRRDIVEPLLGRGHAALGLTLGDVVDDDLSLYPRITAVTASLRVPWLHVAGNHDIDGDARSDDDALQTFRRSFGPDTFAWEEARANFVLLDDVIHLPAEQTGARAGYIGGFRDDQFAFLDAYLPTLPAGRLLVIGVHIPLFEPDGKDTFRDADRARLFALLRRFPHVLLLSAHNHAQRHWSHDATTGWRGATPLHEYNVGAACGAFWSGVKDAEGIPDATMADGTPNGYATLRVTASGAYALAWHPARLAAEDAALNDAMALHAPKVLRQNAYPAWGVYANVFMGQEDTRVEFRIDAGEWKPMDKVLQADPRLLIENMRDDLDEGLRGYDRSPEAKPSNHLWRAALPTTLAIGAHRVEVRTFDAGKHEQRASTQYRLQLAEP